MEYIAPLIQTILWVGLIAGIVWRFNSPIYGLLTALQKRIESGSKIKAGWLELSEAVQAQGLELQVERAQSEVSELMQTLSPEGPEKQIPQAEIKSRLLEAEDLALRALQLEYKKFINRQVLIGPDHAVDGAFTVDGELNIVEIKHFLRSKRAVSTIRRTLETIREVLRDLRVNNFKIIIAVVLHYSEDVEETRQQLVELSYDFYFPIDVHCYGLDELKSQFGLK